MSSDSEKLDLSQHSFHRDLQPTFDRLPSNPEQRLIALGELHRSFRQAVAVQLRPVLRMLLQSDPPRDDVTRRRIAGRINEVLHETALAIVNQESEQAAGVVAEPYRFRLQDRQPADGRRGRSSNTKSLPPLELVEYLRQEVFQSWRRRVSESTPADGRSLDDQHS